MDKEKRRIQKYWTENAPGRDLAFSKYTPEEKEFYLCADEWRYKYDSYIPGLIDGFAERGKLVLEIGCGMGTDSRYMAKKCVRVISMDLSFSNVDFTLKGMRLLGFRGRGVNADAERLPFKDNIFDAVYSFGVLHHTPNTQGAINEIQRVLKPGSKATVMLYHKGYAYFALLLLYGYKLIFRSLSKEGLMSKYDSTPLSKLYSLKQIKHIFTGFSRVKTSVAAFGGTQAHPVLKHVHRLLSKSPFLMSRFGSFIIIEAEK